MIKKPNILVIVGPTSSGKTSLSIELAQKFNGEIISADSRQVYRGLDLGTGKVTETEMQGIPHHLLDVADPREVYTVHDFVRDSRIAIADILSRGKLPIVVGGTFFYIDALLGRVSTPEVPPNEALRTQLESLDTEALFAMLEKKDSTRAETIDKNNRRRLIRALEIAEALGAVPETKSEEHFDTLTLGISISKEELRERIHNRLIARLDAGMIDEVVSLQSRGLTYTRMDDLGLEYRYIGKFLQNEISKEEMIAQIETKSWQYAKRQMTWLKRNRNIQWVSPAEITTIEKIVRKFLGEKD